MCIRDRGKSVLNMFCYTGGFSVYAMRGEAKAVHSVDSSAKAVSYTHLTPSTPVEPEADGQEATGTEGDTEKDETIAIANGTQNENCLLYTSCLRSEQP